MSSVWIEPTKLAQSIYEGLSELEKNKIKNNLNNYGNSIFNKFNYSKNDSDEFILKMSKLLNGDN